MGFFEVTGILFWLVVACQLLIEIGKLVVDLNRKFQKWRKK